MIKHFDEILSTSAYLKANIDNFGHGDIVWADFQTAGYGQKGNHWESERGMNALFSMKMEPIKIAPADGFVLTEMVTLGILDALPGNEIEIKWPNDIYIGDRKLAGILVEATMSSTSFMTAVVGIGLNLNQTEFFSDAPNPVSLKQINGKEYKIDETIENICQCILKRYECTDYDALHKEYLSHLYRINEWHKYQLPSGEIFEAKIEDVDRNGLLVVETRDGSLKRFEFKTIKYIL